MRSDYFWKIVELCSYKHTEILEIRDMINEPN